MTSISLAFDFDLTGRREATFRDLVRMFPAPLTVLQATQPPDSFSAALPAKRYLDWWCESIADLDSRIGAILGYCAGSVFASALADQVEILQGARPVVVLFNPGKPTLATLDRDFRASISCLSSLTLAEQEAAYLEASAVSRSGHAEFSKAADQIILIHERFCKIALARLHIPEGVGRALLGVFGSYISYLRAAFGIDCNAAWRTAISLNSAEGDGDVNFTESVISFPVNRSDLLRTREVAQITYDLLTSGALRCYLISPTLRLSPTCSKRR